MAGSTEKKSGARSRAGHFLSLFSGGYSVRAAADRRRQERTRLRTERALSLWHKTRLRRIFCRVRDTIFMTDLRAVALFMMPMALCATARCLLLPLLTDDFPLLPYDGAAGVALLLLTLLLSTYRAPLYRAVTEDRLLSRLLFGTLALPRPYITLAHGIRGGWLFLLGLLLGVLSVFVSPLLLSLILLAILLVWLVMASPEFGLLMLAVIFPFTILLGKALLPIAIILGLTLLSHLFKLFLGKRDLHFEPIILLLLLYVVVDVAFSFPGSPASVASPLAIGAISLCAYFLTSNLLSTKRIALFFSRGMLLSATILSALALLGEILALLPSDIDHGNAINLLLSLDTRLFPSTEILVTYLLLLLPLLLGILGDKSEARLRLILPLLILLATLILSISPMAIVALMLSLVLFTLLNTGSRAGIFFFLCAVLPNAVLLLPRELCDRFANLFPFLGINEMIIERFARLSASLELLKEHPFGTADAIMGDGASLYLGIGLQSGIFGILAFTLMLALVARDALHTAQLERSNRHRTLPHGCASALFAALVYAPFCNVFSDVRMILLFFLLSGMLSAVCRLGWIEDELHRRHMQDDDHESYATEMRITH